MIEQLLPEWRSARRARAARGRVLARSGLALALAALVSGLAGPVGASTSSSPKNLAYRWALARERAWATRRAIGTAEAWRGSSWRTGNTARFDTVANSQQISRDTLSGAAPSENDTQVEPDIQIDPNNPKTVVATFQQGRFPDGGSVDPGYATSQDGGKHWADGNLPGLTQAVGGPFERASDPVVAFGPDGSVYAQTIAFNFSTCDSAVSVQRSDDGGLTFGAPLFPQDDQNCRVFNDKNWITVDNSPSSPHYGRVYMTWDRLDVDRPTREEPIVLRYSDDRGSTWSPLIDASGPGTDAIGVIPLVHPDGDLTVVYVNITHDPLAITEVSQTSHDGGQTFDPLVAIGADEGNRVVGMRTGGLPSAAIDPITGDMYTVWQDSRFHHLKLNDIVISRSTDGGRSWSGPAPVNPGGPRSTLNHFTPDVAAYGGFVHVIYSTRDEPGDVPSKFVDERHVASSDGGQTFGAELILGPPSNLRYAARVGFLEHTKFLGDYVGVAAIGDVVHAVWCRSSRNPADPRALHQTAWSATITR